jgi:DNA-directed RNA polymerase subunit beta'
VTEVYEARRPKDPATLAEIDGVIELGEKRRGKRTILIKAEGGQVVEHLVPHGKHLRVHSGDRVRAGAALVDGPLVPHDILRISGVEALQEYLLREVQNVYRSQNVTIDDKHHEIIISQMLRKVRVDDPGDTDLLPGMLVDKFKFRRKNRKVMEEGGKPARSEPLLLGITKASLQSESFLSSASFQETTKVLTQAALAGRVDHLVGLKENVILGHLIPAGTGYKAYLRTRVRKNIPLEESVAGFAEMPEDLEALKELKDLLQEDDGVAPEEAGTAAPAT